MSIVKFLYSVIIGVLLVLLVGFGIVAFYPEPYKPRYSDIYDRNTINTPQASQERESEYRKLRDQYEENRKQYNKNISIFLLITSLIIISIGVILTRMVDIIGNGLVLGGLFSLGYCIIRASLTPDRKFLFVILLLSFITSIVLGYIRFIRFTERNI